MKAIVFEIEKFATHDGPGIRTVVFLKGCPLRCKWCHSPESWKPQIEHYPDGTVIGREMTSDEVLSEALKDRDFYEASGGEPLFRWEFVAELLGKAKDAGLRTAVETSGYAPRAAIESVAKVCDLWLYDIKGMDPAKHKEHTGVDNEVLHRNLRWLDANGAKVVLRCPMIPRVNDFPENLKALGELADGMKSVSEINVEPYVAYGIDKAHKLGLKVYEAPSAPREYADDIIARLAKLTRKTVRRG